MPDSDSILGQKVKMMDNNVSFDLVLSFQDVMKDLSCSKEEIARRFKLIIEQKQTQIRKQITDVNTKNLKILQEKSNYFQEVNKTNRQLKQQLLQKTAQNQTLSTQVKSLQTEISELHHKLVQEKTRFQKFEQHTLEDYKRLQAIEIKYKQLLNEIQEQKNRKNQLQRRVNTMNNQKINWGDRIAYLIQNRQKGLMEQYKQEINNLKDILLFYEQDNKLLKQQLIKEKQTFNETKDNYEHLLKTLQLKYGLSSIPTFHHFNTQTEQNSIKRIDKATQISVECSECKKINNLAKHFLRKNVQVQTMKDPREFAESHIQTDFVKFMQKDEEILMIGKVREIFELAEKEKQNYQTKLSELQEILSNQPSKMQDLKTITKLQRKIIEKERTIEVMKNDHLTLKSLNTILHSELHNLKIQIKEGSQVRIDSFEFKKKNTAIRLFTQELEQNPKQPVKVEKNQLSKTQIKPTVTTEKRFCRTVELNSTRKTFSHCKSRVTSMTPQAEFRSSKEKLNDTFRTTDPETFRWQKFQQKLKNPELFSPSPFVNAVRRQKYKKFSSLKKKRNLEGEYAINFTVAF